MYYFKFKIRVKEEGSCFDNISVKTLLKNPIEKNVLFPS